MSKTLTAALLTALTLTGALVANEASAKGAPPLPVGRAGPFPPGLGHQWGHGHGHGYGYGRGFGGVVVIGGESCRVWTRFGFVRVPCDD
jgi:hypothetical protein